ncbi:MAG: Gfo/Idh/MocA family oxidoreductase [Pseudolabrys sp.]|nr:Gfo/Idh/MocA family oxidoreductase [Pseudolabrys sp.]MDP2295555.1 Gfo/Idh/MocA family oxidoreductase [Pseudolabrys sp.]
MNGELRILVVGAGQIGSRHIQALATTEGVGAVTAVDPGAASRDTALARWRDVPGHAGKTLTLAARLAEVSRVDKFDLAIIATSAPGRVEILKDIVALGVRRVLSEKLLFQSVAQLDVAVALCADSGVSLYPNYVYRFVSPWAAVAQQLKGRPFTLNVAAGDIGLATNVPHWLDMFQFLAGRAAVTQVGITLSKPPYASKRGGGLLEIAGAASASAANGATFTMSFDGPARSPVITLSAGGKHLTVDEETTSISGDLLDGELILQVPMVSRTTALAVPQIMAGKTVLPTLAETAEANRLLLRAMGAAMFGAYADDREVPVT